MPLPRIDPAAIPGGIANRMLEREAWARQRLAAHAGRMFVIVIGPATAAFSIDDTGKLSSVFAAATAPDLTLRVSPFDLPAFLANPSRFDRYVGVDGDLALAATFKELAPTMPWLVEQAFANVFGAIAGQRVADMGRRMLAFPEYAAERIGHSIAGYAREQSGLLVTAEVGSTFTLQVGELASRVDAIAARVDALADRLPATVVATKFGKKKARPA
jgi:ubiquinone biosynthesis protein UbiJ